MFGAEAFIVIASLATATGAALPSCYIEPYAAALNSTSCGPLNGDCLCESNVYLAALQVGVPQACNTSDQSPIFSYVSAACSEYGFPSILLTTTSVPLTTSSIPTATVTAVTRITATVSAGATGIADAATSECPKPPLSSGASIGIIIGAFCLGGVLFAAGALIMLRKRKPGTSRERLLDSPYMPYTPSTAYDLQATQNHEKPLQAVEAESKQPRAELMMAEGTGSNGRPAELS